MDSPYGELGAFVAPTEERQRTGLPAYTIVEWVSLQFAVGKTITFFDPSIRRKRSLYRPDSRYAYLSDLCLMEGQQVIEGNDAVKVVPVSAFAPRRDKAYWVRVVCRGDKVWLAIPDWHALQSDEAFNELEAEAKELQIVDEEKGLWRHSPSGIIVVVPENREIDQKPGAVAVLRTSTTSSVLWFARTKGESQPGDLGIVATEPAPELVQYTISDDGRIIGRPRMVLPKEYLGLTDWATAEEVEEAAAARRRSIATRWHPDKVAYNTSLTPAERATLIEVVPIVLGQLDQAEQYMLGIAEANRTTLGLVKSRMERARAKATAKKAKTVAAPKPPKKPRAGAQPHNNGGMRTLSFEQLQEEINSWIEALNTLRSNRPGDRKMIASAIYAALTCASSNVPSEINDADVMLAFHEAKVTESKIKPLLDYVRGKTNQAAD